jgi:hypothetical protein
MYPLPGQVYKHYKGGTYTIISMATHTETKEVLVVYKSLNFGSVYVRPYDVWCQVTETGQKKFILIDENN